MGGGSQSRFVFVADTVAFLYIYRHKGMTDHLLKSSTTGVNWTLLHPALSKRHRRPLAAVRAQYDSSGRCSEDARLISTTKRGKECHSLFQAPISVDVIDVSLSSTSHRQVAIEFE
jgi:hypothetical protein